MTDATNVGPHGTARSEGAKGVAHSDIWDRFRNLLLSQVAVLEEAATAVLANELTSELSDSAQREAHKLSGSLGTFGMLRGSDVAREIETWFQATVADEPGEALRLCDLVVTLRACAEAGPAPSPTAPHAPTGHGPPFLLLVDDDPELAEGLARGASGRGLVIEVAAAIDEAHRLMARRPEAVLIDLAGPGAEWALELMRDLVATSPPIPVLVLTRAGTFTDRVEAARLGGRGFLQKPVTPSEVLLAVTEVIEHARAGHATVLAVDDDPVMLAALTAVLEGGGWEVVALDTPLRFWDTLNASRPDLVILDVDMPEVSGVEMCQVMRADERWSRLPVVFLTSRTDAVTVQAIFAAGADDYVVKPLVGPELLARIANRMERSRLLLRMAETDLLTGVANQRTSAEVAEQLLAKGDRLGRPVVVAMIDIDRVSSINDRFGYAAGDDALARIGHLLLRSFPGDDSVGRWAGQEFCVAMYGMTRADGVQRLAEVLEELRREQFADGTGGTFGVSFSAGVTEYPGDGADLRSLYRNADAAVRQAKAAGGNSVVPLGWSADAGPIIDVVLVEDDEALAAVLLHGLATRSYRTQRFDDGQVAATALAGPTPTVAARVVLLDWGLPSLDGLRVLRRLAETGVLKRTRVIMLTARDTESEVLQALDLGAFDHVAKPFSVPVLMKRVHRAMES